MYIARFNSHKQNKTELVEVVGTLIHETDAAYLVDVDDDKECWLPKSQTKYVSINASTDEFRCELPAWLAQKNGII